MSLNGGCQCGNIKYTLDGEPVGSALCYCNSCRSSTGSTNSASLLVLKHLFKSAGTPKIFTRKGDSGGDAQCHFCGECGSPLWVTSTSLDEGGILVIRSGTLDDLTLNEKFKPTMELYCRSKYSWQPDVKDARKFETMMSH
ncbi:hypothetical protein SLS57_011119 [Botryosphaeria dothidea]